MVHGLKTLWEDDYKTRGGKAREKGVQQHAGKKSTPHKVSEEIPVLVHFAY